MKHSHETMPILLKYINPIRIKREECITQTTYLNRFLVYFIHKEQINNTHGNLYPLKKRIKCNKYKA